MDRDPSISIAVAEIAASCEQAADDRQLRQAIIEVLRRRVGFDAYAWVLTDPETEVGSSPLADVPGLPDLPRLIRLKYLEPLNRWTSLGPPVRRLRDATGDDLARSLLWREVLAGHDVCDLASMVFRDRFGCWGFLDLWRCTPSGAFTDREVAILTAITDSTTRSIRRCHARTFTEIRPSAARTGPAVLLLGPDLAMRAQTEETEALLVRLVPRNDGQPPVPAGAFNVAAQLLASEQGVDDHAPSARVHLGDGVWLTLRAARIGDREPWSDRDIAVTIESASPAERLDLFARSHGLSARESELVGHLVTGADTRTIAQAMFLSEHTVQDHLKSVFANTGAGNRRLLVARVQG